MKNQFRTAIGLVALLAFASAVAHHSGAMFDAQKTMTLQGTVKDFRWGNPHCWIQLLVPRNGVNEEWSIEMGSTTQLYRSGWRPRTLQDGDKVAVVVHPLRNGSAGAQFLSALAADGAPLGKARTGSAP
jgi:Family of unknown function (DUF6152)